MPLLRPPHATTATRMIVSGGGNQVQRTMATSHGHESPYEPPSGWFLNTPPGVMPKKEGWENIFFYGFFGSLAASAVGWAYKPDTSIQTWALEEARRRLETEKTIPDSTKEVRITVQLDTVSGK